MIQPCKLDHLPDCVDIAFSRNNIPEFNCAFCPVSKEEIHNDFEHMLNHPDCMIIGYFDDGCLLGILGCFYNPDNHWVDCIGPFFKENWYHDKACLLFSFAFSRMKKTLRFNFYFHTDNKRYHELMQTLSAVQMDNEYILILKKDEYTPQHITHSIQSYSDIYQSELICLHDSTFQDVYVTGYDIIQSIGKTREVFCAIDETDRFVGYGVLKYTPCSRHLTAEIFTVKKIKRGQGYGWALLNTVIEAAFNKHRGNSISLVVDRLNTNAKELYLSCGFQLVTENESYFLKPDHVDDSHIIFKY